MTTELERALTRTFEEIANSASPPVIDYQQIHETRTRAPRGGRWLLPAISGIGALMVVVAGGLLGVENHLADKNTPSVGSSRATSATASPVDATRLSGRWVAVPGQQVTDPDGVTYELRGNLVFDGTGTLSGGEGCGTISGHYALGPSQGDIRFEGLGTTLIACTGPSGKVIDQGYLLSTLPDIRHWEIDGNGVLSLSNGSGHVLFQGVHPTTPLPNSPNS